MRLHLYYIPARPEHCVLDPGHKKLGESDLEPQTPPMHHGPSLIEEMPQRAAEAFGARSDDVVESLNRGGQGCDEANLSSDVGRMERRPSITNAYGKPVVPFSSKLSSRST